MFRRGKPPKAALRRTGDESDPAKSLMRALYEQKGA